MIRDIKVNENETIHLNQGEAITLELAKRSLAKNDWDIHGKIRCNDGSEVGYDQALSTLTAVETRIAREKNMEVNIEEAIDVVQGPGAWKSEMQWYEGHYNGGDSIESWRLDLGQHGASKGLSTASLTKKTAPYMILGKMVEYTRSELEQAEASGIWNPIEERAEARKREFDRILGKFAFHGTEDKEFEGLLTLSNVKTDVDTTMKSTIASMTDSDFAALLSKIFTTSYVASEFTTMPNVFLMPSLDRIACSTTWSTTGSGFSSGVSRLQRIEDAFRNATGDANAKVIGVNYANAALNGGYNQYALYRKDRFELHMEMPVPFGIYQGNTVDGFNFQNTALAQVSGVVAKYKQQINYFKVSA